MFCAPSIYPAAIAAFLHSFSHYTWSYPCSKYLILGVHNMPCGPNSSAAYEHRCDLQRTDQTFHPSHVYTIKKLDPEFPYGFSRESTSPTSNAQNGRSLCHDQMNTTPMQYYSTLTLAAAPGPARKIPISPIPDICHIRQTWTMFWTQDILFQ